MAPAPVADGGMRYEALAWTRTLRTNWRTASFSSLLRRATSHQPVPPEGNLGDRVPFPAALAGQGETLVDCAEAITRDAGGGDLLPDDPLLLPQGSRVGDCAHAFFERIDFMRPETFLPAATQALALHPVGGERATQTARLVRLAENVLNTPLPVDPAGGLALRQLPPGDRWMEFAFHLPATRLSPARVAHLLAAAGEPLAMTLDDTVLQGYLRGFIDLVFRHAGRYYLLDWKSNALGHAPTDYASSALFAAMREHGYFLQARIYLLALHRYLRARLPDYDPARHLGGACYLFVRGLRPAWRVAGMPTGFYWLPPDIPRLLALERELGMPAAAGRAS
jgi:exodeoxyribonuclease V beta subunit